MADTHESVRNLNEMLMRLGESQDRQKTFGQEQAFKNKQLEQQAMELEENRKARAAQMAEMIAGRKQAAFLPFQEKMLNEEQKIHPKWTLQQQTQDMLGQMKPEYRDQSAFSFDKNFKQPMADGGQPGSGGEQGPGLDIGKSLGLPELRVGLSPEQNLETSLTPFAIARAKALQMKMKVAPDNGETTPAAQYVPGGGSNLGF